MKHLYVVYLGGPKEPNRMGEDHEVVVVIADDVASARKAANLKWHGAGSPHVDSVMLLEIVDGYQISLSSSAEKRDVTLLDTNYTP